MSFAAIFEYIIAFVGNEETLEMISSALRMVGELIGTIFQ